VPLQVVWSASGLAGSVPGVGALLRWDAFDEGSDAIVDGISAARLAVVLD